MLCEPAGLSRAPTGRTVPRAESSQRSALSIPILELDCDFPPTTFLDTLLDVLQDASLLPKSFLRAEIVHDSERSASSAKDAGKSDLALNVQVRQLGPAYEDGDEDDEDEEHDSEGDHSFDGEETSCFPGFFLQRTIVRRLIPRHLHRDRPILQTCRILHATDLLKAHGGSGIRVRTLALLTPAFAALPGHYPGVQSLAYLHVWTPSSSPSLPSRGRISLQLRCSTSQSISEPVLKYAAGQLRILQERGQAARRTEPSPDGVQKTFAALEARHGERLCAAWAEPTDPAKRVREDLGVAAWLIEAWKDMYALPRSAQPSRTARPVDARLPPFPGFVDIGCGDGLLTDVLLAEGYPGFGIDARQRPTWTRLLPATRGCLREALVVPQPLLDRAAEEGRPTPSPSPPSSAQKSDSTPRLLKSARSRRGSPPTAAAATTEAPQHNGLFPPGTFLIAHHADELVAWTPLLAASAGSPFVAVPCCAHNLSGARFRAPGPANSWTACALAPTHFAARQRPAAVHAKSVPIGTPLAAAETGDLKRLAPAERAQQGPSSYDALCGWVGSLAREIGFEVVEARLPTPSTRNAALLGRLPEHEGADDVRWRRRAEAAVREIARREAVDVETWLARCAESLADGAAGAVHG